MQFTTGQFTFTFGYDSNMLICLRIEYFCFLSLNNQLKNKTSAFNSNISHMSCTTSWKAFSSDSVDFVTIIIIVQFISLELWNEQHA